MKALGIRAFDDVDGPVALSVESLAQLLPGIAAIGEDMPEPWISHTQIRQKIRGTVPVLNVGRVNQGCDEIAVRVRYDVPFAALDLLACVKASRAATFRRFHRPAVDDAC